MLPYKKCPFLSQKDFGMKYTFFFFKEHKKQDMVVVRIGSIILIDFINNRSNNNYLSKVSS